MEQAGTRRQAPDATASGVSPCDHEEADGSGAARIEVTACAKVNLTLEVLGKRQDGFHEIRSVMQRITLADTLTVEPAATLTLTCSDRSLEGPDNLVWRAATLLRHESGISEGATLHLEKRIPIAAGLGGGSADAAAALTALARLWRIELSHAAMIEFAAQLGSDVPFFLASSPTCLVEGRGERLTELAPLPATSLVLLKPSCGISAGSVYARYPRERWSDGRRTDAWLSSARSAGTVPTPFNDLEPVALAVEPRASVARDALARAGGAPVMSGSGSTYFSLFPSEQAARETHARASAEPSAGVAYIERFVTL